MNHFIKSTGLAVFIIGMSCVLAVCVVIRDVIAPKELR